MTQLSCYDCGLPYAGEHWVEAVVPDDIWNNHLSPNRNEGGILCINCMAARAVAEGLSGIPVKLTAGPFVLREDTTPAMPPPICSVCDMPHREDYVCSAKAAQDSV